MIDLFLAMLIFLAAGFGKTPEQTAGPAKALSAEALDGLH
jgi:hypothetical protein